MNLVAKIVIGGLGALAFGNLLTYSLQYRILFRPSALPNNFDFKFSAPFEEVNISSTKGGRLNCLWFKRPQGTSQKGVILYFHGNQGTLERWGQVYSQQFEHFGYDMLMIDYRGYGKSTGPISEKLFFDDALAVHDFALESYPPDKIIIYGRSIGSGPASYLASVVEAQQLLLETPFASMSELFHSYYPFLPKLFMFRFPFNNAHHLKDVSMPITVFAGTKDYITPYRSVKRLQSVLKESDTFLLIEGGGHNDLQTYEEFREILGKRLE